MPGDYLTLSFVREPAADEVTAIPEISTDLATWSAGMNDLVRVSVTVNPDGTLTELWRTTVPVSADRRRYGRVRVAVPQARTQPLSASCRAGSSSLICDSSGSRRH